MMQLSKSQLKMLKISYSY